MDPACTILQLFFRNPLKVRGALVFDPPASAILLGPCACGRSGLLWGLPLRNLAQHLPSHGTVSLGFQSSLFAKPHVARPPRRSMALRTGSGQQWPVPAPILFPALRQACLRRRERALETGMWRHVKRGEVRPSVSSHGHRAASMQKVQLQDYPPNTFC